MQPALQYMAGELRVEQGDVLPLLATHNTVRMRFDMEEAEYLNLSSPDATFPMQHFSMLADTARNVVRVSLCRCISIKDASACVDARSTPHSCQPDQSGGRLCTAALA